MASWPVGRFSRANGLLHIASTHSHPRATAPCGTTRRSRPLRTPCWRRSCRSACGYAQGLRRRLGAQRSTPPAADARRGLRAVSAQRLAPSRSPAEQGRARHAGEGCDARGRLCPRLGAVARRYYVEARYGHGTPALMERYEMAMERATSLDPNSAAAVPGLVVSRVERGDLVGAYAEAADLVRRRPDNADGHFALVNVCALPTCWTMRPSTVKPPCCSTQRARPRVCDRASVCNGLSGGVRVPARSRAVNGGPDSSACVTSFAYCKPCDLSLAPWRRHQLAEPRAMEFALAFGAVRQLV